MVVCQYKAGWSHCVAVRGLWEAKAGVQLHVSFLWDGCLFLHLLVIPYPGTVTRWHYFCHCTLFSPSPSPTVRLGSPEWTCIPFTCPHFLILPERALGNCIQFHPACLWWVLGSMHSCKVLAVAAATAAGLTLGIVSLSQPSWAVLWPKRKTLRISSLVRRFLLHLLRRLQFCFVFSQQRYCDLINFTRGTREAGSFPWDICVGKYYCKTKAMGTLTRLHGDSPEPALVALYQWLIFRPKIL